MTAMAMLTIHWSRTVQQMSIVTGMTYVLRPSDIQLVQTQVTLFLEQLAQVHSIVILSSQK